MISYDLVTMSYKDYFKDNNEKILEDFFTYLKFKTVSTKKDSEPEMRACISWLKEKFENISFKTEIIETTDFPTLYAENLDAGEDKPTILLYGHYDVQPIEPLELWNKNPFEPYVEDNNVYGRGTSDNKAQSWYTICALKAIFETQGKFPINIKFIIEGSEECASNGLIQIADKIKDKLKADSIFIVDSGFESLEKPAVCLGCRGVIELEVTLKGAKADVHSGLLGGILKNPINELSRIIATMHNEDNSIAIDNFYDDLVEPPKTLLDALNFEFDKAFYSSVFGAKLEGGEKKYKELERVWLRPTIDVNGIIGGYTGEGMKTIIPSLATAKISSRIVLGQKPSKIKELISNHIRKEASEEFEVIISSSTEGGGAVVSNPDSRGAKIAREAISKVTGKNTKFIMIGGSIPIAPKLQEASGGDIILIGFALAGDKVHAPNEHFGIDRLEYGFLTICDIISNY